MFPLLLPDDPAWAREDGYSPAIAEILIQAYIATKQGASELAGFAHAYELVAACMSQPMSDRQRVRSLFVLGFADFAVRDYAHSLVRTEEAIELALSLSEYDVVLDLLALHGYAYARQSNTTDALIDHRLRLDLFRTMALETGHVDHLRELELLAELAEFEFLAMHEDAVQSLYGQAQHLTAAIYDSHPTDEDIARTRRAIATLEWSQANTLRWFGDQDRAFTHALASADVYLALGPSFHAGRISSVVAEIALAKAEAFADAAAGYYSNASQALASLAESYLARALTLMRESGDAAGQIVGQLIAIRYDRLLRRDPGRLATAEVLAKRAAEMQNADLVCRTQMVLGEELTARGEAELAIACHTRAVESLRPYNLPYLDVWSRRSLLMAREMRG